MSHFLRRRLVYSRQGCPHRRDLKRGRTKLTSKSWLPSCAVIVRGWDRTGGLLCPGQGGVEASLCHRDRYLPLSDPTTARLGLRLKSSAGPADQLRRIYACG